MKRKACAIRGKKRGGSYVQDYDIGGDIMNTLTSVGLTSCLYVEDGEDRYVRRLTASEYGRLMGIDEDNIRKVKSVLTENQSKNVFAEVLAVDVAYEVLRKLFVDTRDENRVIQLELW